MKRKTLLYRIAAASLISSMLVVGCGKTTETGSTIQKVDAPVYEQSMDDEDIEEGLLNFSFDLFKASLNEEGNTAVSPISVIFALDMLVPGSEGETKEQILSMMCQGAEVEDLVKYANEYLESLDEKQIHIANGTWINETIVGNKINPEYVAILDEYLGAKAELAPFNENTKDLINDWVNKETKKRIPSIIDQIPDNAALYLVNAMAFDGQWEKPYEEYEIDEYGIFINADGKEEDARMLNGKEELYIENNDTIGFIKKYAGGDYAFVAMLPTDETISIDEYVSNMSADDFSDLIKYATDEYTVYSSMPCFKYDYDVKLNDALFSLGMENAFNEDKAEFKLIADLGEGHNIYVNRVLHKAFIELDENGTKAGAATAIEMVDKMSVMIDEEKYVFLNRPFAYAIIDTDKNLPVMLGTVKTLESSIESEESGENTDSNQDVSNVGMDGTLGQNLLNEYKNMADDNMSAQDIANELLESDLISFAGASMPVEEGYLNGFGNEEITGFEEGVMFAPMIGSIPFIGYVFDLEDGADVDSFKQLLKDNADPRWNVCTEADETIIVNVGNQVFFLMCPRSIEE